MKVRILSKIIAIFICILCSATLYADDIEITSLTATPAPVRVNRAVLFTAELSEVEPSAEYRFVFGDGVTTDWMSSNSVSHTYQMQAHYNAQVQVRANSGFIGIQRTKITVLNRTRIRIDSTNSNSLAVENRGNVIWTVNPDNNSISKINRVKRVTEYYLGADCNPRNVTVTRLREIWVTCQESDQIKILNRRGRIRKTINLAYGSAPFGIATAPNDESVYVSLYGNGQLLRINRATKEIESRLNLAQTAKAIAISRNSRRVYVTRFISPQNHGEVWKINATRKRLRLIDTIILAGDTTTADTISSGRGVPNYLSSIAIDPTNQYALVTANKSNTYRGVFLENNDLNTGNTNRAMLAKINLRPAEESVAERRDIDNSESPSSVAFSPFGDYAFIAAQGNNFVAVFDLLDNNIGGFSFNSTLSRIETGLAPQGIVFNPRDSNLITQNFMSRSLSYLAAEDFLNGNSGTIESEQLRTIVVDELSPQVLLGKQIFYNASDTGGENGANRMSAEGYISCATCHFDGGDDGRVWDFTGRGEGLRNTTDLRGRAGTGHGRIHWSGNFDEIQDFENDIRNNFGGAGFMSDADFVATTNTLGAKKAGLSPELDALSAYVTSLGRDTLPKSPFKTRKGLFTAKALQGQQIFTKLNCTSCHSGINLTDSTLNTLTVHDVGSIDASSGNRLGGELTGIDTPTLHGIFATPPYLHNGSAEELEEIFDFIPGLPTFHSVVDDLGETEKEQLLRFLIELDGRG